jgi:hypothetical protein
MSYPSTLDNIANVSSGNLITAAYTNSQTNAINAIESTLGTNPQGSYATVAAALVARTFADNIFLVSSFT